MFIRFCLEKGGLVMYCPASKAFWKTPLCIMAFIFLAVTVLNIFAWSNYGYMWNGFCSEQAKARKLGYEKSFFICSREENISLNGENYVHFHAYHPAFLDGAYEEELLMPSSFTYLDKVPEQQDGLVIFAKEVSSFDVNQGENYKIINIYSVCDYALAKSKKFIRIVLNVTIISGVLEILLVFILAIHRIRRKKQL